MWTAPRYDCRTRVSIQSDLGLFLYAVFRWLKRCLPVYVAKEAPISTLPGLQFVKNAIFINLFRVIIQAALVKIENHPMT